MEAFEFIGQEHLKNTALSPTYSSSLKKHWSKSYVLLKPQLKYLINGGIWADSSKPLWDTELEEDYWFIRIFITVTVAFISNLSIVFMTNITHIRKY